MGGEESEVSSEDPDACLPSFGGEFSFESWAGSLARQVLKSGTSFAHFLSTTLHLHRSDVPSAPTALSPIPSPSALRRGGAHGKGTVIGRALHVLVMALNFLHSGLRPVPPEPLRRLRCIGGLAVTLGRVAAGGPRYPSVPAGVALTLWRGRVSCLIFCCRVGLGCRTMTELPVSSLPGPRPA